MRVRAADSLLDQLEPALQTLLVAVVEAGDVRGDVSARERPDFTSVENAVQVNSVQEAS